MKLKRNYLIEFLPSIFSKVIKFNCVRLLGCFEKGVLYYIVECFYDDKLVLRKAFSNSFRARGFYKILGSCLKNPLNDGGLYNV